MSEPYLGKEELENVSEAVKTGWISSNGHFIKDFESRFASYIGTRHGVSVCNGTAAIHLALAALGIGKGDEVILPSITSIACANSIVYTGAKAVFADSDRDYWCISPEDINRRITKRTKAIMVVHIYGHPCDMDPIMEIAEEKGIHKKYVTILLGPRDEFVNTKATNRKSKDMFTIGYIGALSHRKNVIFILRTALLMKSKSQYRFMIYGSGPELQNLLKFKSDSDLNNVSFMGFAPEKKLLSIYDSFDLFFYPTLEEGSSLPMLDAQARGLPVVILRDNMVDKPVTKYCFKVGNEKSAAGMIERLLKGGYSEKQKRLEIKYAKSFSWDNIFSKTLHVYAELLKSSTR